jgi:hypothetical protein
MNPTSLAAAGFGALLYAIFGVRIKWWSIPNVVADVRAAAAALTADDAAAQWSCLGSPILDDRRIARGVRTNR